MTVLMREVRPHSSFASIDLGTRIADRLGPTRLLGFDGRRELFWTVRGGRFHAELEQLRLEFGYGLDLLQLGGEPRHDLLRRSRRRDDALPRLPIEARDGAGDRRQPGQKPRRF